MKSKMIGKIHILEENEDPDLIFIDSGGYYNNSVEHIITDSGNESVHQGLIIDKAAYTVYLDGVKISFPKKEFELLLLLAANPRKVVKREEILSSIWGKEYKAKDSRSLDVHIRMLRKKLNDNFITTIRGVGYKLEK